MPDAVPVTPRWLELLNRELAAPGASSATVARRIGYCSSRIRRAMNEDYVSERFQRRVLERLDTVYCPGIGQTQPRIDCRQMCTGSPPTWNPAAMRIWNACQKCEFKPEGGTK